MCTPTLVSSGELPAVVSFFTKWFSDQGSGENRLGKKGADDELKSKPSSSVHECGEHHRRTSIAGYLRHSGSSNIPRFSQLTFFDRLAGTDSATGGETPTVRYA